MTIGGTIILTSEEKIDVIDLNQEVVTETAEVIVDVVEEVQADFKNNDLNDFLDKNQELNTSEVEADVHVSSEDEDDYEEEDEDFDLNNMLKKHDFLIVLKTDEPDMHFIVPQIDDYEDLDDETKDNIAQNHFFLGYINHAMSQQEWIEEYSKVLKEQNSEKLENVENAMETLLKIKSMFDSGDNEFLNSLKNFKDELETSDDEDKLQEKMINFEEAIKKLNANKPKIIT